MNKMIYMGCCERDISEVFGFGVARHAPSKNGTKRTRARFAD